MENLIQEKANRSLFARRLAKIRSQPSFRARQRRELTAAHLGVAIAGLGLSRAAIARKAKISPAQLSRQLSGDVNLTLNTIGKICEAAGLDFDVVFRLAGEERVLQPWERENNRRYLSIWDYTAQPVSNESPKPTGVFEPDLGMKSLSTISSGDFLYLQVTSERESAGA